jgi:hypothetical protein
MSTRPKQCSATFRLLTAFAVAGCIFLSLSSLAGAQDQSDAKVAESIIQECISTYLKGRPCPCPYSGSRLRCFINAWSIPGGAKPFCYKDDVSADVIKQFRDGDIKFIAQRCTARP